MSSITETFQNSPAFIPYITAGDPSVEASKRYVESLASGGADVIELGLPFSDPICDGPTIERAANRSLEAGMTPDRFFEFVNDLSVSVPLVAMTYSDLVYSYSDGKEQGVMAFVADAADAGIDGILIPDLPVEECGLLRDACDRYGLDCILIVSPNTVTDEEQLNKIMDYVSGFVYVQAWANSTGQREDTNTRVETMLSRLDGFSVPNAVGFGISEPVHAKEYVKIGADGVIVGSELADRIESGVEIGADPALVADSIESNAQLLKAGCLAGFEARK